MVISKKTTLFQGFRGSPTFSRGRGGVQRGPNAHFYRNPYNLSFSRGESGPLSPLSTRSCSLSPSGYAHELPSTLLQMFPMRTHFVRSLRCQLLCDKVGHSTVLTQFSALHASYRMPKCFFPQLFWV